MPDRGVFHYLGWAQPHDSFGRDDKVDTRLERILHAKRAIAQPQTCHLDRSVAKWRACPGVPWALRFSRSRSPKPLAPGNVIGVLRPVGENLMQNRAPYQP